MPPNRQRRILLLVSLTNWLTCCRRKARSAFSSITTRFMHSSTCRLRKRSSAPANGWDVSHTSPNHAIATSWRRAGEPPPTPTGIPVRHRDWVQAVCGLDTDAWIHPPLIRFLAGYLDQGLAHWPMPERSRGIHGCFLEIYRTSLAAQCGPWARALPRLAAEDYRAGRDAFSSIANSLAQLGVADAEWEDYLGAELLALRGWAGIVRQIEERPDRVPARDLTVTLRGYLAVRLLFERAALEHPARQISF